jgi:hypothetical protein
MAGLRQRLSQRPIVGRIVGNKVTLRVNYSSPWGMHFTGTVDALDGQSQIQGSIRPIGFFAMAIGLFVAASLCMAALVAFSPEGAFQPVRHPRARPGVIVISVFFAFASVCAYFFQRSIDSYALRRFISRIAADVTAEPDGRRSGQASQPSCRPRLASAESRPHFRP